MRTQHANRKCAGEWIVFKKQTVHNTDKTHQAQERAGYKFIKPERYRAQSDREHTCSTQTIFTHHSCTLAAFNVNRWPGDEDVRCSIVPACTTRLVIEAKAL